MRRSLMLGAMLGALVTPGSAFAADNGQIVNSITNGLANLYSQQTAGGYWNYGGYEQAATGAAVSAFMSQQPLWGANAAAYQAAVDNGMNYLLSTATKSTVTTRLDGTAACPGGASSCTGVDWYGNAETTYTTGLVMSAVGQYAATKGANTVATNTGALAGQTWGQIAQGVVNQFTAGQTTANNNLQGGWRYFPGQQDSDGSTTQWAVISMIYGQSLGATVLPAVYAGLNTWTGNIQAANGSGCYQPGSMCDHSDTGSLLLSLAFLGKNPSDPAVQSALAWLNSNWTQTANNTWYGNFGNPYAMWADYKALEVLIGKGDTATITNLSSNCGGNASPACNWWQDYNQWLVSHQNADGSWSGTDYWTGPLATAFDVSILGGTVIPPINAVPEPSTWVMMLLGFATLGFAGYRRSRKETVAA